MPNNAAPDSGDDTIDRFMVEWTAERPDLDFNYLATIGRILRVSAHLREQMDAWLSPFGLSWEMFDLLVSLRRSGGKNGAKHDAKNGAKHGMRPTELYEACMLSSGATTNRIDRAEKLNYAVRRPDPDDGRATRIALTKRGQTLADKAMTEHTAQASEVAECLTAKEQEQLAHLLRKMLRSFEVEAEPVKRKTAAALA